MTDIVVVSTHLAAPTADICKASVRAQRGCGDVRHIVTDAGEQRPPKTVVENVIAMVRPLPDETVVAWVDADDHLAHRDVLAGAVKLHEAGAWVTYGSFMRYSGEVVVCRPYQASPRDEPWFASHLRTFKAGLFKKLKDSDLQLNCLWVSLGVDQAIMLPLIELAGLDRTVAVPDVRLIYNDGHAWERTASDADLARERKSVELIRGKPRYARLEAL